MTAGTVAGVYAQALLELADERGKRTVVVEACRELADALVPETIAQLNDPRVGKVHAKATLRTAFAGKIEQELIDLLMLLVDRNRLSDAPAIAKEAVRVAEAQVGLVRVNVTTAQPLAAAAFEKLSASLQRILGYGVVVHVANDPALIGGLTLRVGDLFVDGSVRRQLGEMRNRILSAPVNDQLWSEI